MNFNDYFSNVFQYYFSSASNKTVLAAEATQSAEILLGVMGPVEQETIYAYLLSLLKLNDESAAKNVINALLGTLLHADLRQSEYIKSILIDQMSAHREIISTCLVNRLAVKRDVLAQYPALADIVEQLPEVQKALQINVTKFRESQTRYRIFKDTESGFLEESKQQNSIIETRESKESSTNSPTTAIGHLLDKLLKMPFSQSALAIENKIENRLDSYQLNSQEWTHLAEEIDRSSTDEARYQLHIVKLIANLYHRAQQVNNNFPVPKAP